MFKNKLNLFPLLILTIFVSISEIHGHGMMLDPVSRSSRWRYDKTAPINYDDNGLFCGGFTNQWNKNHGKCGLCGDDFAAAMPRQNEIGGKYGQGVITKAYSQSESPNLGIKITTNHLGFFYFHICNLDKFEKESEECFNENKIKFSDGSLKMYIGKKSGMINPKIVLPEGLNCKHCVLRWNYQAGNNWGPCGNGTSAQGCGPQENFKGCSDISITKKSSKTKTNLKNKIFKSILNENNNLELDDFVQREETHLNQHLDNYLYDSSNNKHFDNIDLEFGKEFNNDIDNTSSDSDEEEEKINVFVNDQLYEGEDVDETEAELFNPQQMQEMYTELQSDDQLKSAISYDFNDNEGLENNQVDNIVDNNLGDTY